MNSNDGSENDVAGAPSSTERAPPSHLYKFRSMQPDAQKFTKAIVVQSELYFATPEDFNDPFDQLPAVSVESTPAERETYYRKQAEQSFPDASELEREVAIQGWLSASDDERLAMAREALAQTNAQGSLCSLSARNDAVLMWSHYAANHTGICLRFKVRPDNMFGQASPVRYQRRRPVINRIKMATAPVLDLSSYIDGLITKADFWAYEEEWRVLRTKPAAAVPFKPRDLDGIILGARITADAVKTLREWVAERPPLPLEFFQAVPRQDTFRLDIVQLD